MLRPRIWPDHRHQLERRVGTPAQASEGVITKWGERFTMRRHAHERPSGESRNDMESWLHREYARGVLDRRAAIR